MDSDNRQAETFADELDRLKQQGCNLLLVHKSNGSGGICENLLGAETESRRRLYIATTRSATAAARPGVDAGATTAFIDASGDESRSSATAVDVQREESVTRLAEADDLDALRRAFDDHVDQFDAASAFDPGEFRVCFDSLDALVARTTVESVFHVLHPMTARIRSTRGMGHYHYHRAAEDADEDETIRTLMPLFDIRVDVRMTVDGMLQQRWVLPDAEIDTGWLQMGAL